jgi:hypothetical protein
MERLGLSIDEETECHKKQICHENFKVIKLRKVSFWLIESRNLLFSTKTNFLSGASGSRCLFHGVTLKPQSH